MAFVIILCFIYWAINLRIQSLYFFCSHKPPVMLLAAFGLASMWLAVFADVGVAVIAILNAMRTMN